MNRYCVINCIDGRVQIPAVKFITETYQVDYVDNVTEAGPVQYLAEKQDSSEAESILRRVNISREKNMSKGVVVTAHYDCKGNPKEYKGQIAQLDRACKYLKKLYPETVVIGLWINDDWQCEEKFKL